MKKIVAIMAVLLMLFTSCGKAKDLITPGLNGNSDLSGNNVSIADKTLRGTDSVKFISLYYYQSCFFCFGNGEALLLW